MISAKTSCAGITTKCPTRSSRLRFTPQKLGEVGVGQKDPRGLLRIYSTLEFGGQVPSAEFRERRPMQ
jgi:hypothetical protein